MKRCGNCRKRLRDNNQSGYCTKCFHDRMCRVCSTFCYSRMCGTCRVIVARLAAITGDECNARVRPPGTAERVAIFEARVAKGEPLFQGVRAKPH